MGHLEPGQTTSRHRHSYETIIYVLEGEGYTLIEDERVEWATEMQSTSPFEHGTNIAIPARLACAVTSRVKMRR